MIQYVLSKLPFNRKEKLNFLNKRLGGVWLIWIGLILIVSIMFGGDKLINQTIFYMGYGVGLYVIFGLKAIRKLVSYGPPSLFQKRVTNMSIVLMFVLLFLFGGPFYATMNYRLIWLGSLLAVAIHFIPFTFVHGKSMFVLSVLLIAFILVGYTNSSISFPIIGYIDSTIKICFGTFLLFSKKPNL
jgi:hypothetical protein